MKKIILVVSVCSLVIILYTLFISSKNRITVVKETDDSYTSPTPTDNFKNSIAINIDNTVFYANYAKVSDISKVNLVPNFETRFGSEEYLEKNKCNLITSSVFYSKSYDPIGFFVSNGLKLAEFKTNSLFDSVFSITIDNLVNFTNDVPTFNINHAIQTGPTLLKNGEYSKLAIKNDDYARRLVLAYDSKSLYFIVFFDKNSLFSGPFLASLPEYVQAFAQAKGIDLSDAVNLDGGSASVYIDDIISLREISPVGAFFCVKE